MDDFPIDSFLKNLTMEQLEGDSLELAQVIGIEAFRKLVAVYGGSQYVYIPRFTTLRCDARNQQILADYRSGATCNMLAKKYHLSNRFIRFIINKGLKAAHQK